MCTYINNIYLYVRAVPPLSIYLNDKKPASPTINLLSVFPCLTRRFEHDLVKFTSHIKYNYRLYPMFLEEK